MKHKLLLTILFFVGLAARVFGATTEITNNGEYYIISDYYNKVLGDNGSGSPALSTYGKQSDNAYRFVAETSGSYFKLRLKSSGKYLTASTANTWSVLLSASGSGTQYQWKLSQRFGGAIVSAKNTSARLGSDFSSDTYVGVYYNKAANSRARFTVIPALSSGYEASLKAAETASFTNTQGVAEKDDYCVTSAVTLSTRQDYHIVSTTPFDGGSINITDTDAWVIFDNIHPSKVVSTYLSYIKIKGATAVKGTNCRVAIFLAGAAVIPCKDTDTPFHGYTTTTYGGTDIALTSANHTDLGDNGNLMRSFKLKRGYMAVLATGTKGSGYSRVYVADHADLSVALPTALDQRVSSVNIRPWNYVSKKGLAGGTSSQQTSLNATWTYNWNCNQWSTQDVEYIPIKQHIYWPSWSDINQRRGSSAVLGYNEPEHSEQHTSSKCSCGGTIDEWAAYTHVSEALESGMRIGSPSPTDASWLKTYMGYVDNMKARCDFAAYHAYWGTSEANGSSGWYSRLKSLYDNTKRPIWITEWAIGASWITTYSPSSYTEYRDKLIDVVEMLERTPFIERYSYYMFDTGGTNGYMRALFYDEGGLTPAGEAYKKVVSTFAYNADYQPVPNWWAPSAQTPTLTGGLSDGKYNLIVTNPNGDATAQIKVEKKVSSSTWTTLKTDTNRSGFESATLTYPLSGIEIGTDVLRVTVTTLYGGTATSEELTADYLANPEIVTTSKSSVPGWTCLYDAYNGVTKDTGDTYFEVWGSTASNMNFNYYQDVSGLENGVYSLSAVCFNSTNGEAGASVTGRMGLYAQADGLEYFSPVTVDSEINYDRKNTISKIVVRNGSLRVGIKNIGVMTARWAGADNFKLTRLGSEAEMLTGGYDQFVLQNRYETDKRYRTLFSGNDASQLIVNRQCLRGTNYGWTTQDLSKNSGESFDGNANNTYWDKYMQNLSSSMSQTIQYVPAGRYQVSSMLRAATNVDVTFSVTVTPQEGEPVTVSKTFTGIGADDQAGSAYKKGWQLLQLPEVAVGNGDQLTISASASGDSDYGWWSADNYTLTYKGARSHTLSVSDAGYATLYLPFATTVPAGATAYSTQVNGDYVHLNTMPTVIPAYTGMVVKAAQGNYAFSQTTQQPSVVTGNALLGTCVDKEIGGEGSGDYILGKSTVGVAFVKANEGTLAANKAYLHIDGTSVKELLFDEATGIESFRPTSTSSVTIEGVYNLAGQVVDGNYRGIVIINGKKTLRK